jgi:hypothetical protein
VPLVVPVGELTNSASVSGDSGIAMEISQALDVSLSEIQARYFRDSDVSSEVEQVLAEKRDILQEDLQESKRFNENMHRDREAELRSYYEDSTF